MSTHVPGIQSFFRFLYHFVLAILATSVIMVKVNLYAGGGLNLTHTKWCEKPVKWLKPWHIGIPHRVLSKSYQINTNMTGFRGFSKIFASLCFGRKYSLSIGRVKVIAPFSVQSVMWSPQISLSWLTWTEFINAALNEVQLIMGYFAQHSDLMGRTSS